MVNSILKILSLEDNDFDFELVERKLKSFLLTPLIKRATCEQEFEEALVNLKPDIILSDFTIPSFGGMEALHKAKRFNDSIPFIFVSGSIGEEKAVETLKEGANDYVLKENLNKLQPAIERALKEVQERTRRMEAEKKLFLKNLELRTLVYRISHDIKGPICTIKGLNNLALMRTDKNEENYLFLMSIEEVTEKLERIIKNLNVFQYIFADTISFSDLDLDELLEDLNNNIKALNPLNIVKYSLKVTGNRKVKGEVNLLYIILYNLIQNSFIFSDKTKSEMFVECFINSTSDFLELSVRDNGIGIPEAIKNKVCDMFFRGNTLSKGAGLGLYVVKKSAEILNAELKIESIEKVGTRVMIKIPQESGSKQKELDSSVYL